MAHISKDKRNNIKKIQNSIDNTIENYNEAKKQIEVADSPISISNLKAKNERRLESLSGMKDEIREETKHNKNN
ncbi:small acid-soluble spore protein Tlp [Sedimentibacter sp. zth1]|uniref:small acid-soluble spore protein Tlp n=1 Tax=Sedimentibacter sp. zth1 TaxID=2816908 RepID=UPI001A9268ED|nr:small acid-soluble spore protein Tlp [Sedimentibacter sp. zth1]QSX06293.1 small acid-soluble spore protein Tlp [Sedimentibacter sp. zth1]